MYIVHTACIKITMHIQVPVYCKKCFYPLDYWPTQKLCTTLYTTKKQ